MHSITAPATSVESARDDQWHSWHFDPYDSWSISWDASDPPNVEIIAPLSRGGLAGAEPLLLVRVSERFNEGRGHIEILQKIPHIFNLHWVPERRSYCKVDKNGDLVDAISIFELSDTEHGIDGEIVTFKREILYDYMNITKTVIVRAFDFSRFRWEDFKGYGSGGQSCEDVFQEIYYRSCVRPDYASYMRGAQIIRPSGTIHNFIRRFEGREENPEYATFIAQDSRSGRVMEISCEPGATANYFMHSDLPFELSPAFFRPDVLSKYRADPDKYVLQDRHINCRGAWDLRSYDINEEGQVHVYILYLRDLPYAEQLYWKSFNEAPRGGISSRAYQTDIEGRTPTAYDPLNSLIHRMRTRDYAWWSLRSEQLPDQLNYPATSSSSEWGVEITRLDQLIVEGLEEKYLRKKATQLGRKVDKYRSLKLVEECLIGMGFDEERARNVMGPLHDLHNLRSSVGGAHASGKTAKSIRTNAIADHGSYRQHFHWLCTACDEAIRVIADAMKDLE